LSGILLEKLACLQGLIPASGQLECSLAENKSDRYADQSWPTVAKIKQQGEEKLNLLSWKDCCSAGIFLK
jgi:hypothetical protein